MMRFRSVPHLAIALLVGLVLLSACRTEAPPETFEPEVDAPSAPEEEFADPPSEDPEEVADVRDHRLSMDDLRRYGRASEAVHGMAADDAQLVTIEDLDARLARAQSLDDVQRILSEHPGVQQALDRTGITTREYVLIGAALLGAYTYMLMREHGIPDPYRPDYIADHHLRFIEQNREEVDVLVARLQALFDEDA